MITYCIITYKALQNEQFSVNRLLSKSLIVEVAPVVVSFSERIAGKSTFRVSIRADTANLSVKVFNT